MERLRQCEIARYGARFRFNRRAMRPRMPGGNTMRSIPPIAWWPASWSRRWNEALQAVHRIEGEIAAIVAAKPPPLGNGSGSS